MKKLLPILSVVIAMAMMVACSEAPLTQAEIDAKVKEGFEAKVEAITTEAHAKCEEMMEKEVERMAQAIMAGEEIPHTHGDSDAIEITDDMSDADKIAKGIEKMEMELKAELEDECHHAYEEAAEAKVIQMMEGNGAEGGEMSSGTQDASKPASKGATSGSASTSAAGAAATSVKKATDTRKLIDRQKTINKKDAKGTGTVGDN